MTLRPLLLFGAALLPLAAPDAQPANVQQATAEPAGRLALPQRTALPAAARALGGGALDLTEPVAGFSAYQHAAASPSGDAYAAGLAAPSDGSASLWGLLARVGPDGTALWTREFESVGLPAQVGGLAVDDAGACLLTEQWVSAPGDALGATTERRAYVHRIASTGDLEWSWATETRVAPFADFYHVASTEDGGCAIAGAALPIGEGWLVRLDVAGDEAGRVDLDGQPGALTQTPGGFLVSLDRFVTGSSTVVAAFGPDGAPRWEAEDVYAQRFFPLSDGGAIAVWGGVYDLPIRYVRLAPDGTVAWSQEALPGFDLVMADATADGRVALAGGDRAGGLRVLAYGTDGSLDWASYVEEGGLPQGVTALGDGGVVVAYEAETPTADGPLVQTRVARLGASGLEWAESVEGDAGGAAFPTALVGRPGGVVLAGTRAAGYLDAFARAFAPDGTAQGGHDYATPAASDLEVSAVTEDGTGGAYVAGRAASASFVARLDAAGAVRWREVLSGDGRSRAYALVADASGPYIAAAIDGPDGTTDLLTVALSPDGAERWRARYDGRDGLTDLPSTVVPDGTGGAYVAGASHTSAPDGPEAPNDADALVLAYDENGALRWERRPAEGSGFDDHVRAAVAIPPTTPGERAGLAAFVLERTGNMAQDDDADVLALAYDADGDLLWSDRYTEADGSLYEEPNAVATDGRRAYVAAHAFSNPPFRSQPALLTYDLSSGFESALLPLASEPQAQEGIGAIAVGSDGPVSVGSVAVGTTADGDLRYLDGLSLEAGVSLDGYAVEVDADGYAFVAGSAFVSGNPNRVGVGAVDTEGALRSLRATHVTGASTASSGAYGPAASYQFYLPFRFDPYRHPHMALVGQEGDASPLVVANRTGGASVGGLVFGRSFPAYAAAELRLVDRTLLTDAEPGATAEAATGLGLAVPNPARGAQRVPLTLAAPARVRAAVFDLLGREIATLHDGAAPAGRTDLSLPTDLAPGVYVVRAEVGAGAARRMLTQRFVRL